jgi:hypothetical protein
MELNREEILWIGGGIAAAVVLVGSIVWFTRKPKAEKPIKIIIKHPDAQAVKEIREVMTRQKERVEAAAEQS